MLTYKINVIGALKKAGYNTTRLKKEKIISQTAMQKIRAGDIVGPKILDKLCELLDLQPGDIIEYNKIN